MRNRLLQRGTLILGGLVVLAGCRVLTGGDEGTGGDDAGSPTQEASAPLDSALDPSDGGTLQDGGGEVPSEGGATGSDGGVTDAAADAEVDDGGVADAGDPGDAAGADAAEPPDAGGPSFLIYTCLRKKAYYADYDAYRQSDTYWAIDSDGNKFTGATPAGTPTKARINSESTLFYAGPQVGTASPPPGATLIGHITAADLTSLRAAIATLAAGPAEADPTIAAPGAGYLFASSQTAAAPASARRMDYSSYRFGLHLSAEGSFHKSTFAAATAVRKFNCASEFGTVGAW